MDRSAWVGYPSRIGQWGRISVRDLNLVELRVEGAGPGGQLVPQEIKIKLGGRKKRAGSKDKKKQGEKRNSVGWREKGKLMLRGHQLKETGP